MANRYPSVLTNKASTNTTISGAELTGELSNKAYPESAGTRFTLNYAPLGRGATAGATPAELFIDGTANFRFRPADQSTVICKVLGAYTCSAGANDTVFELTFGITNRGGTVILLANSVTVKMPNASTATLVPTIVGGNLVLTATGVAGDANGRWTARMIVNEVTDLG
jgi:hypothetical protein